MLEFRRKKGYAVIFKFIERGLIMFRSSNKYQKQNDRAEDLFDSVVEDDQLIVDVIKSGDLEKIKQLYEGRDINSRLSLQEKNPKGLNYLQVKLHPPIPIWQTGLSVAMQHGQNDIALFFLEKGARVEQSSCFSNHWQDPIYSKYYRRKFYTTNLLGLACFSPINHEVFIAILRKVEDFSIVVFKQNNKKSKISLLKLLDRDLDLQKDDKRKRLSLLLCEAILKNNQAVLCRVYSGYCKGLTATTLSEYITNIELDAEGVALAKNSIHYLIQQQVVSVELGEKLKIVIEAKFQAKTFPIPEKLTDVEKEKELCSDNADLAATVQSLVNENTELRKQVGKLIERLDGVEQEVKRLWENTRSSSQSRLNDSSEGGQKRIGLFS